MQVEKSEVDKDVMELMGKADNIIVNTIRKIKHDVILMYFNIGKMICEFKEKNNSKYGDAVVKKFSEALSLKYGSGFNKTDTKYAIQFYMMFGKVRPAGESAKSRPADQLDNFPFGENFNNITWSHITKVLRLSDVEKALYYLNEVEQKKLSKRELGANLKTYALERTMVYQREGKISHPIEKTLKDPIIGKGKGKKKSEKQLEDEIINNLADFKNELGNVITFLGRQHKINVNGLTHKVDLVFLDYETNTFILIDLKVNKVSNKDIHQMQMYIKHFSSDKRYEGANVVGLILCETKDVRLEEDDNIYQIKYLSEMPKERELLKIIEENKVILLKTESLKDK